MLVLRPKVYFAYSAGVPEIRELFELGLLYDRVFDGGGTLEPMIESSRMFAKFLETGQAEDLQTWDFDGLAVILLDSVFHSLRSQGVSKSIISKIFWNFDVIDELRPERKKDSRMFRDIVSDVARILARNYPNVWQKIITLFRDLPLLKEESLLEYSTLDLRKITHPALSDYLFQAMKLDEKDPQFRRIAHKVDNLNPVNWTTFTLNNSIMESSYLGMDLYTGDRFMPLLKYRLLRGASRDAQHRKRRLMQESLSLLVPDIYNLDIPSFLEIRNSNDARLLRGELVKAISSENITEANA